MSKVGKIPANLIPVAIAPDDVVREVIELEWEANKLQKKANREMQQIAERLEDRLEKFRQEYELTTQHSIHTPSGYVVVAFNPQEQLNDLPEMPVLRRKIYEPAE